MKKMRALLVVLAVAVILQISPAREDKPAAAAFWTAEKIALDGVLNEPDWTAATWQTNFVSASASSDVASKPLSAQTRFKVVYDDSALFVAVECDEPNVDKLRAEVTEHDGMVWGDDCVEIFFDPAGEGRYYHHFVINSKGAWYDDYGADYGLVHSKGWNCPIEFGTKVDAPAKVWRVEVRIPFAALVLRTDAGQNWLFNVARERYAGGAQELSTWSPLKGNFHAPRLFGKLTGVNVDFRTFAFDVAEPQVATSAGTGNTRTLNLKTALKNQSPQGRRLLASAQVFGKPQTVVRAAPFQLTSGAVTEVTFPPLTVSRSETAALIQFTIADADTGAPYKIVVKDVSTEYKPLVIDVLRPVYRQNVAATENVPQIVFRVALSDDVAARAQSVTYSLINEAGTAVRKGETTVKGLKDDQTLEVGKLPFGAYRLMVKAIAKDGATVAEAQTTIRKLPPAAGNEVRIDEHRNILVNGKPKVFIGWYGNVPLEDPRADVVALQDIQTPVVLDYPDVTPVAKAFQEHGIYSIVSVEPGRLFYTFKLWQKPGNTVSTEGAKLSAPSEECRGYVKQLVELVKNQPGLLGYYLADEPEINNMRSDYLENFYKLLQELDPYHPVIITNDTLDGIVTHGYKACDILNPDPYSPNYDYVPNFMKKALEVGSRGKATMMTPWHASGQAHFTDDYGTAPPYSYKVMRHQYLAAIAFGCRGFTGYTSPFFMPEPILRYGLPHVWREVRFLEPAMSASAPPAPLRIEADAEMAGWIRQANGNLYLIVVNHKPGARKVTVSHPLLKAVKSLVVVSEGRLVAVNGSAFTDQFAEGDARIYTTNSGGGRLPTTADVEKEIKDREAASVKRGNLLHWTRGVRARASQGYYAPWFHQYYYYAINGISDDDGWHVTHAPLSQWLELTLPKAAKIGRVVVHTPNLRDYDVQFQSPDGSTQVAEIRGNTANAVEHNFNPPMLTLKLRITARAVREGTRIERAMVREVEAYETPGTGAVTPVKQGQATAAIPAFVAPATETSGTPTLWLENFTNFRAAEKHSDDGAWVFNPQTYKAEPKLNGGVVCASLAPEGYAAMSRYFPYDSAYRFFQVRIDSIEGGEGYKFGTVVFSDGSGKPGFRGAVNTNKPGIYTVDTHYIHEVFRQGTAKNCFIALYTVGSGKRADGSIKPGWRFTFDWIRLGRRPQNGLAVTMADGSPLPDALQEGDELLFRLFLDKPAQDVIVEVMTDASYVPVPLNGEPYAQLLRASADGREWAAAVKLGAKTGKYEMKGYPVLFRARITGGEIAETFASAFVSFR
jgi:hypothetical protein